LGEDESLSGRSLALSAIEDGAQFVLCAVDLSLEPWILPRCLSREMGSFLLWRVYPGN